MTAFEHGYALVVGVAGYCDRALPELPLAVLNDAVDFAATLLDPEIGGYRADRVRQLLNDQATEHNLRSGLEWLRESCTEEDTAIIFFSGHGWHGEGGSCLAAYDARVESPREGLISAEELTSYLGAIGSGRLAIFLDCCYAGEMANIKWKGSDSTPFPDRKTGLDERAYRKLASGAGRAILAASQPGARSIVLSNARNSIFTECLLEGMRGAAVSEEADTIGMLDVFQFVSKAVLARSCGFQKPLFKAEISENFPLSLVRSASIGNEQEIEKESTGNTLFKQKISKSPGSINVNNIDLRGRF